MLYLDLCCAFEGGHSFYTNYSILFDGPNGLEGTMRKVGRLTAKAPPSERRYLVLSLAALCMVLTLLSTNVGLGTTTMVQGDPGTTNLHWNDAHRYLGNCTQKPIHEYFFINDTALFIDIAINFSTNSTFPGAILEVRGPDSYDVFSEDISVLTYHTKVTDLSKRGIWSVALSMNYCTFQSPVEFDLNLIVHNRHLGTVATGDKVKVLTGEPLHIHLIDFQLAQGEQLRLDLGDGRTANLGNQTVYDISYDDPGAYTIKAQVQSDDGTATGWKVGPQIMVGTSTAGTSGPMAFSGTGAAIALVLIGMLGAVVFLTSRP